MTYDGITIRLPRESLWMVAEVALEYGLGVVQEMPRVDFVQTPRVLDIGANCGIFAIGACQHWPGARVLAFEPHPETVKLLRDNVAGLSVYVHELAVVGGQHTTEIDLYEGGSNRLQVSRYNLGDGQQDLSRRVKGKSMWAGDLPPCDILKVDTEGEEIPILAAYPHLGTVKCFLAEIHRQGEFDEVRDIAARAGLSKQAQVGKTVRYGR